MQGVGFRVWVRDAARRLRVRGQVRNLPGGEVEVVAAGDPAALNEFAELLRTGPRPARVDTLQESTTDIPPHDPFAIVH